MWKYLNFSDPLVSYVQVENVCFHYQNATGGGGDESFA